MYTPLSFFFERFKIFSFVWICFFKHVYNFILYDPVHKNIYKNVLVYCR